MKTYFPHRPSLYTTTAFQPKKPVLPPRLQFGGYNDVYYGIQPTELRSVWQLLKRMQFDMANDLINISQYPERLASENEKLSMEIKCRLIANLRCWITNQWQAKVLISTFYDVFYKGWDHRAPVSQKDKRLDKPWKGYSILLQSEEKIGLLRKPKIEIGFECDGNKASFHYYHGKDRIVLVGSLELPTPFGNGNTTPDEQRVMSMVLQQAKTFFDALIHRVENDPESVQYREALQEAQEMMMDDTPDLDY